MDWVLIQSQSSLFFKPCLQVPTQPQPCLVYKIWHDHSLRENACNTLWQCLTWLLIEMGRNADTLCIGTHKIASFYPQKLQSFSVAAGVETYELIWKMCLFFLMKIHPLRSFNYIMSCCVPVWNATEEHVVTRITVMNCILNRNWLWKGIWRDKAGSPYICGSHECLSLYITCIWG